MDVTWFGEEDKCGQASFYKTNLTLNTVSTDPFRSAYRVRVGGDKSGNIVIMPLDKDQVERDYTENIIDRTNVSDRRFSRN